MTINGFYLTGMFDNETLYLIIDGYWDKKEILVHYQKEVKGNKAILIQIL